MLLNHRRALVLSGIVLALTAVLFLLVWFPATRPAVQRIDDAVFRAMDDIRTPVLTFIAKVFDFAGGFWGTFPIRVVVSLFLLVRRRWGALAAWVLTWVLAELALTWFKILYARPRPPDPLVATKGFSFPSGHAVAGTATAVALVLVLLREGPKRRKWEGLALGIAFVMAFSRVYLDAHWLSDVLAGTGLGFAIAVGSAGIVTEASHVLSRRRERVAVSPP